MNFLTLKYFRTVATELNVTHAAQKLYISQQALSFHMRKLEQELGVELFTRGHRLALTDAGRYLLDATVDLERTASSLNDRLNEIRREERGELRVGLSFTRGQFILPQVLPDYAARHPQVHINIFEEHSEKLKERLFNGEIDFWISADKVDDDRLVKEPLFTERFFLVAPRRLVPDRGELGLEDLARLPFILLTPGNRTRDLFDAAMRGAKLTPNMIMETDNAQTAFALAQRGMALTIYSDMFLRNYHGELNRDVLIMPFDRYLPSDMLHVYYADGVAMARYKTGFLQDLHKAFV